MFDAMCDRGFRVFDDPLEVVVSLFDTFFIKHIKEVGKVLTRLCERNVVRIDADVLAEFLLTHSEFKIIVQTLEDFDAKFPMNRVTEIYFDKVFSDPQFRSWKTVDRRF
jgi:hypothetical protein